MGGEGQSVGSAARVSVLMPTFNQRAFIGRALGSLLAQTLPAWELLIIDDGATDGTGEIVAPFLADPRIRYERFPKNRGLGAALNRGLARARAPLIAYLPSDDLFYPEHLASLVALFDAEATLVLAYSGVRHTYSVLQGSVMG